MIVKIMMIIFLNYVLYSTLLTVLRDDVAR